MNDGDYLVIGLSLVVVPVVSEQAVEGHRRSAPVRLPTGGRAWAREGDICLSMFTRGPGVPEDTRQAGAAPGRNENR